MIAWYACCESMSFQRESMTYSRKSKVFQFLPQVANCFLTCEKSVSHR